MGTTNLGLLISGNATGGDAIGNLANQVGKLVDKIGQAQEQSKKPSGMDKFAENVKNFIQNPLQEGGNYAEAFLKKIGPIGATLSIGATAAAAFGAASYKAMKDLAEFGDQIDDMSARTGLSIREVGELSFAMKRSGGDIGTAERAIFELTRSTSEYGAEGAKARKVLADMGVSVRDSNGELLSSGELLMAVSDGFVRMKETGDRNVASMALFKRAGREILPDLLELSEGIKRARELGIAPSEHDVARWGEYQKQIAEVDAQWERLVRMAKEPLALVLNFAITGISQELFMRLLPIMELNAGVRAAEEQRANIGASESRSGHRRIWDSEQRGKAMIAADRARFGSTSEGLSALYSEAKTAAEKARTDYFATEGSTGDVVRAAKQAWDDAAAAVSRYKKQLDDVTETEKRMKELATFIYKEGADTTGAMRSVPSLFGPQAAGRRWSTGPLVVNSADIAAANQGRDQAGADMGRAYLEGMYARQQATENLSRSALDHQVRMIQLLSGPGGEVAAIQRVYDLRVSAAKTTLEMQEAIYAREEAMAELQKKRIDDIRDAAGQVFDAMLKGGAGLQEMLTGQLRVWQRTIFQNLAVELTKGLSGHMSMPGTTGADGKPTMLGRILTGTPFGPDPLKLAGATLTSAGVKLELAAQHLMAVSATGGGGGLVRSTASAIPGGGGASVPVPVQITDPQIEVPTLIVHARAPNVAGANRTVTVSSCPAASE